MTHFTHFSLLPARGSLSAQRSVTNYARGRSYGAPDPHAQRDHAIRKSDQIGLVFTPFKRIRSPHPRATMSQGSYGSYDVHGWP